VFAALIAAGALLVCTPAGSVAASVNPVRPIASAASALPGSALSRVDNTPFPPSKLITSARWASKRYDPPVNQSGDILPTVWSDDGATYVLMDDGGVDAPIPGGFWRQSLARISGTPPKLTFKRVGNPWAPPPRTWAQIGGNRDRDDGPLGPYYSIGFTELDGVFYATQQRNWNWSANARFTGLVGVGYSTNHGRTWRFANQPFPAPLGNLTFVVTGGQGGGPDNDGYVYAIGTEREFNASRLILGRVLPGVANVTEPARWQWYAGSTQAGAKSGPVWSGSPADAVPVMGWNSHITYPQMTNDAPLHRYLLTFTYSHSSRPPGLWKSGADLVIVEGPTPWGPFSFVAGSRQFGPSNGYGAGFPSQWISRDGQTLWLKWAANFAGCSKGLDCSGKYGFNVAKLRLTLAPRPVAKPAAKTLRKRLVTAAGVSLALLFLAGGLGRFSQRFRRRCSTIRRARGTDAGAPQG
jgi:hypothetical protein